MKILLCSHLFHPSVGGIEQVSRILADGFTRRGESVKVVTQSPGAGKDCFDYPVLRKPGAKELLATVKWCDVCFHNNPGLQTAWPLLLHPRPWVIAHQTWLVSVNGRVTRKEILKRMLLRFARNVAISKAVAERLPVASRVIGNPYRDDLFFGGASPVAPARDKELIFVGRLVSDKGADVLLEALGRLRREDLHPGLTFVGDGPELESLRALATRLELNPQVSFAGTVTGTELAWLLKQHRVMVVPSRWDEPFGIVVLEAIACGCVVVGSERGGLKEAIGSCGVTFPNGDAAALAAVLSDLLRHEEKLGQYRVTASEHLKRFSQESVVESYLNVFRESIAG